MKARFLLLALALTLTVGACASTPKQTTAEKLEFYRAHAGEPVNSFQYFGSINGWNPLGDSALVVWTRPNQAYLLELFGPCMDLDYAPGITISNMGSRVSARFDSIQVHGGGSNSMRMPCRIETIRPLDVKSLKQAQQELRKAEVGERPAEQK